MNRWNPNLLLRKGGQENYNEEYLSQLVDTGRRIEAGNTFPVLYTLGHFAKSIEVSYQFLRSIVLRNEPDSYKSFRVKKRSGGFRLISVPKPTLMVSQAWINQHILSVAKPHRCATGFVPGMRNPLKENASRHCGATWLLQMDLSDFFNNISEAQVYGVFRSFGYPPLLSFEMARICTRYTKYRKGRKWYVKGSGYGISGYFNNYIGCLPQGAPTSPALSNLVCIEMDEKLDHLTTSMNGTYTRYADDLCFSFVESTRTKMYEFKRSVNKIIWESSFNENKKKSRITPPGGRKLITGLVIDSGEPTIPKELRDQIRRHLYYADESGISEHCRTVGFRSIIGFHNHLNGLIGYVESINEAQGAKFRESFNDLPWINLDI